MRGRKSWWQNNRRTGRHIRKPETRAPSVAAQTPQRVAEYVGVGFGWRLLEALDMSAQQIATKINSPLEAVEALLDGKRGTTASVDLDPEWIKIANYVDTRIGLLIGVREDLNRKLASDRQKRMLHRMRVKK